MFNSHSINLLYKINKSLIIQYCKVNFHYFFTNLIYMMPYDVKNFKREIKSRAFPMNDVSLVL